jgi:nitronate monooxygenase
LAAALALGASGVLCGTGFFASEESLATPNAKHAVLTNSGDDTQRSSVFDMARGLDWPAGWNVRALRNSFTEKWGPDIEGFAQNLAAEQARFEAARIADDTDIAPVIIGEATDLVRAIEPAQDTVSRMISQAENQLRHLGSLIGPHSKG